MITATKHDCKRKTEYSAGYDLAADGEYLIQPGTVALVKTGVYLDIPKNYFGMVVSRSSMALAGVVVANSPGIIDADYKDEVMVMLRNATQAPVVVTDGQRVAQLVFVPYVTFGEVVGQIRQGGIGSTGK
jgi:dUTP pyrophosphatase